MPDLLQRFRLDERILRKKQKRGEAVRAEELPRFIAGLIENGYEVYESNRGISPGLPLEIMIGANVNSQNFRELKEHFLGGVAMLNLPYVSSDFYQLQNPKDR